MDDACKKQHLVRYTDKNSKVVEKAKEFGMDLTSDVWIGLICVESHVDYKPMQIDSKYPMNYVIYAMLNHNFNRMSKFMGRDKWKMYTISIQWKKTLQ